jgi:hypothetical protein
MSNLVGNTINDNVKIRIDVFGHKAWYRNGKLHREDGPAIEYSNGDKEWYVMGKRHREDGPAIECANGNKYWYKNDRLHRTNGPAIELANGEKEWWINGVRQSDYKIYNNWLKEGF